MRARLSSRLSPEAERQNDRSSNSTLCINVEKPKGQLLRKAWGPATEKFLAKYLGGRYQESATPEVAARLAEITVDPKTVVLAQKADAASGGKS